MLQLSQCKISYKNDSVETLKEKVAKQLRISKNDMKDFAIVKKSIDARKKPDIYYTYTVRFTAESEEQIKKRNSKNKNLMTVTPEKRLEDTIVKTKRKEKVVVVGAGPAGLFCGYYLSLCGFSPVIVERGKKVEERINSVERFWKENVLDEESNVSFGEGGAGTFSDGKLNTGVKDSTGKKAFILETFVKFGARENILYDANPHIGTDVLREVVANMREEMVRQGCEFLFQTKLTDISMVNETIESITVKKEEEEWNIPCDMLVLAIGHSARDTFAMLDKKGIIMTQKPFAVGMRVQHRQDDMDMAQYGVLDKKLPATSYKCTGKTTEGRGVYSFCMCPGGYVVNASSEKGHLVVNGMSDVARDSGYANSAIIITVGPDDFEGEHCLAGVEFQRKWEQRMYQLCDGKIPVQRYEDFKEDKETAMCGKITPCIKGTYELANLRKALPNFVVNGMIDGMEVFAKKIRGFNEPDTLLLGIETRTSSPVRIERNEEFVSVSLKGLYPCGEGAGYAGGIMSAAMDGLRVAMKIQEKI